MLTWGELADKIGMSRSMLDFVKNGRPAGPKVLRLIVAAEREAGLISLPGNSALQETAPGHEAPEDPYAALSVDQLNKELDRLLELQVRCANEVRKMQVSVKYRVEKTKAALDRRIKP